MDTKTTNQNVEQEIAAIKAHMPETYKAILAKAAEIGKPAYALVRRGLRGEVNCFYAMEHGRVVGAPFEMPNVTAEIAMGIVQFGCTFLAMWGAPPPATEGGPTHGAH